MKSCWARRATLRAAAVAGLFFFYVAGEAAVRAACEIKFRLAGRHFVVVQVRVDGRGPFELLLDTGTDTTILTPEAAALLALRPTSKVVLETPTGARPVPRAAARSFSVGPKPLGGGEILIDELRELRALGRELDGIVGQNLLGRFNFALDYGRGRLLIEEEGDEPPAGARLVVEREEGKLLVTASAARRGASMVRLLLDSAAGGLVLFDSPALRAASGVEAPPGAVVKASTNAGSRTARAGRLRFLSLGGETYTDLPAALLPAAAAGPRREHGLLPTSLFRSIYFNNAEGYVVLNPRLP
jgi:hypothetical protein